MRDKYVSLDAPALDGRTFHEVVADSTAPFDQPDSQGESESLAYESGVPATRGALALVHAVATARNSRRRSRVAEREAAARRCQADADTRRVIEMANALVDSVRADSLGTLSAQQLAIVRTRIEIVDEGDVPTHHEVARRLGLHPAAISRQWARILAKLAAASARDVSTSAA